MNEILKIKYNSFYSFLSIASRLIPNVLIFWILARYFGPTTFGKFSYSHTLANTFLLFADFGFDLLITTEIAQNRSRAKFIFQQYFWIKIALALLSLLGMLIFVLLRTTDFESIILGFVFAFYMLFNTVVNFYVASFKGFEKLNYDAKVSVIMNLFLFVSAVLLFLFNQNIFYIALTYVVSRILGLFYSIKLSGSILPELSYKITTEDVRESFKKAFLYGMLILTSSFLFQLDTILLGIIKSDFEVGIYQAVKNLLLVPFIIPGIVFSALLPTLARIFKENSENWLKLNNTFFKIVFWINLPITVILFSYPRQIIEIIYSTENYLSAVPILRLFSIILFLRSTSDYLGVMLITSGRQKKHIYTSLLGIFVCALSSSIIIPSYGAFGAAIVYLIVILTISTTYLIMNYKIFFRHILDSRYFVLLLLTFGIAYLTSHFSIMSALIGIPLIFLLFILFAFSFFFNKNEINNILSLKSVIGNRKRKL